MLRTATKTVGGKGLPPYGLGAGMAITAVGRQPFADLCVTSVNKSANGFAWLPCESSQFHGGRNPLTLTVFHHASQFNRPVANLRGPFA